jgi:lysophospholipase L1-like esterase
LEKLFLVTASLLISLLALEISVRLVVDDGMQFDLEMWKYARALKRPTVDPLSGHEHIPNSSAYLMGVGVVINQFGHRDELQTLHKPDGVRRILMLGDSVTFGWGVAQKNTTSEILQALLNDLNDGWQYQVVNMGIGNANTDMEVRALENDGWRFMPDVIVLNFFINDAEPTPVRESNLLTEFSYAFVFLSGRIDVLRRQFGLASDWRNYYSDFYRPESSGWRRSSEAITRLAEFSRNRDIGLVIANYPELHELANYPFASITADVAAIAQSESVEFVDLLHAVAGDDPQSLWVHPGDAHPNATATAKFAAALLPIIQKQF